MNAGAKIAAIPRNIAQFFREIPAKTVLFWKNRVNSVKSGYSNIRDFLSQCDWKVLLSLVFMGAGNIAYKQYAKGIIYLLLEAMFIVYMSLLGGEYLVGLVTLGTVPSDPWSGKVGDNSVVLMLMGILTVFVCLLFILLYVSSLRSALSARLATLNGQTVPTFIDDVSSLA